MLPSAHPPELSVVIPAYNEARRISSVLHSTLAYLMKVLPGEFEILVVDDGSEDRTAEIAEQILGANSVLRLSPNQGKGAAVRAGMLKANGKLRLFMDADGATPIEEEEKLRAALAQGADIAIGSRASGVGDRKVSLWGTKKGSSNLSSGTNAKVVREVLFHRHLIGRTFAAIVNLFFGLSFQDTQCGFKMCTGAVVAATLGCVQQNRFVFDVEWLYLAKRQNLMIQEIPVSWSEVAGSKVSLWRDPLAMFLGLCQIRLSSGSRRKLGSVPLFNMS